jgi:hypothetical protein
VLELPSSACTFIDAVLAFHPTQRHSAVVNVLASYWFSFPRQSIDDKVIISVKSQEVLRLLLSRTL